MAEIVLEEFAKELKLIKVVGYIYAVAVMVTFRQGFLAIRRAFTMVSDIKCCNMQSLKGFC